MRLMNIAALVYVSVGLVDVLNVVSAASRTAIHLRYSISRGDTKSLMVRMSIGLSLVRLRGDSRLLTILVVWSTIAVRNRSGRPSHSGVI